MARRPMPGWIPRLRTRRERLRLVGPALAAMVFAAALASDWSDGLAFPVLWVVTALNLSLREEFPFSHFPMYASFADRVLFLRVTDDRGRRIALGSKARLLTKIYATETGASARQKRVPVEALAEDDLRRAADRVFDYLEDRSRLRGGPELTPALDLYEVRVFFAERTIRITERRVGSRRR